MKQHRRVNVMETILAHAYAGLSTGLMPTANALNLQRAVVCCTKEEGQSSVISCNLCANIFRHMVISVMVQRATGAVVIILVS
jgi:hypothetical protein